MDIIYTQSSLEYKGNEFPEGPYRLEGISGIGRKVAPGVDVTALLQDVHSEGLLHRVRRAGKRNNMIAEVIADSDTYEAALQSIRLAYIAAKRGYFACTRPPGHHADTDVAKGFCFFNNMAIVSQALVNDGKKVCIIDFDGHQGDGTEQIFYESDQVLFISIHQEFVYPYYSLGYTSRDGYDVTVDRTGKGAGKGFTCNIPVPEMSGDDVLLDFLARVQPAIEKFSPDIIGVSAGFDGYHDDALLNLNYSQTGYFEAGKFISNLGIDTFAMLEGGYHHDLVECIEAFVAGINREDFSPNDDFRESKDIVMKRYREY